MFILIDLTTRVLMVKDGSKVGTKPGTIHDDGIVWDTWVGIGRRRCPTPIGVFHIAEKIDDPVKKYESDMYGTRCLDLDIRADDRPFSIHGTNDAASIGKMSSGGCIRLNNRAMEELYEMVEVGETVIITMSTPNHGEQDWTGPVHVIGE